MRTTTERISVKERFDGLFTAPIYDGSFDTEMSDLVREDFAALTDHIVVWTQVHGDVKNAVARAAFVPYPHWSELYAACRDVIRAHSELRTEFWGPLTCAKLMGDAMALLRKRNGLNVPKWWLPIMVRLRSRE